jgi:hypothetical protein
MKKVRFRIFAVYVPRKLIQRDRTKRLLSARGHSVAHEMEAIDALANAAVLEADLKAVVKEYDHIHSVLLLEAKVPSRNLANKANSNAFSSELEKL